MVELILDITEVLTKRTILARRRGLDPFDVLQWDVIDIGSGDHTGWGPQIWLSWFINMKLLPVTRSFVI